MKFVICDDTHFFSLDDFKEYCEKYLTNIKHKVIKYEDLPDDWKKEEYSHLKDCFDSNTDEGMLVDLNLNDLQKLSDGLNSPVSSNYFFIDMKEHIIVITPWYPDN